MRNANNFAACCAFPSMPGAVGKRKKTRTVHEYSAGLDCSFVLGHFSNGRDKVFWYDARWMERNRAILRAYPSRISDFSLIIDV